MMALVLLATINHCGLSAMTDHDQSKLTIERQALRRRILASRDSLAASAIRDKSREIASRLWNIPQFFNAATPFCFVGYKSEPDTMPIIREAIARGKTVAVPRTVPGERLDLYRLTDPETELAPGYCSIPEPLPGRCPLIDPAAIDLILMPGSVFDPRGGRLGYGGGYYDRFIAAAPNVCRIAIAFELQLVEAIPLLPHDQPWHILVTENRILHANQPV